MIEFIFFMSLVLMTILGIIFINGIKINADNGNKLGVAVSIFISVSSISFVVVMIIIYLVNIVFN